MFKVAQRGDSAPWSESYRYTFAVNSVRNEWTSKHCHRENDTITEYGFSDEFRREQIKIIIEVSDVKK